LKIEIFDIIAILAIYIYGRNQPERGIKYTWLAEQLGKSYNIVNGYVQNRQQPRLVAFFEIADIRR